MKCTYLYLAAFLCLMGASSLNFSGCAGAPPAEPEVWAFLEQGENNKAQELFLGKADVRTTDSRGRTPLHIAAEKKDPDLATFFISLGSAVDAADNEGRTPLGISAEQRDPGVAKILVAAGADIHRPMPGGSSPALTGIEFKGDFLAAILSPASVESADTRGRAILHLAALAGDAEALEKILKTGSTIAKKDADGMTALDLALAGTSSRNHAAAAEKLILAGAYSDNPIFSYFAPAVRSSNYNLRTADGGTILHFAAREGYTGLISFFIEKKADVNLKNASGTTPLHEAARSGHIQAMDLLLARGAEVNAQDAKGNSVLHIGIPAALQREAISLLLSYEANPNPRDEHGDSPLHIAITLNRNPEILQALLAGGADVSMRNIEGKTPLYLAVEEDRTELVPLLISYKSDVFAVDNAGITPFEKALQENSPTLVSLITTETVLQSDSSGNTILHAAVKNHGDAVTIGRILEKKAVINARNKEGDTGLHLAVRQNDKEAGEVLLTRGADIFAPNAKGESPLYLAFYSPGEMRQWMINPNTLESRDGLGNSILHYAAQWNLHSQIPFLIKQGTKTEVVNATGETPLFTAARYDAEPTIRALITLGASLNNRDNLGNSVLHAAVRWNAQNAAITLIDLGVDLNAHALNGKTPIHDAVRLGMTDIELILIRAGANLEVRDGEGNTPFLEAVMAGYPGTAERLAEFGADPTVRNNRGDTPLHIAVGMERSDLISLLIRLGVPIHGKNAMGRTPFQTALSISPRMVSALLTKDLINVPDDNGATPLHLAIQARASVDIIKIIVEQGARLSPQTADGRSPLRIAVDQETWDVVKFLADAGSDPFSAARDGKTPAENAFAKGSSAVQAVFSGKAINARDSSGNTVLHYAAKQGNPQIITQLLELGANKSLKNITAESPADIAQRWDLGQIAVLLN